MIVATAGHVDHGKTSLVRQLTGVDTDRLEEEKRRGLSINLGFAYSRGAGEQTIGFIDVPGHNRFINNMIAGVRGIDMGMLVVAADDGPMPQTLEHLDIMRLLGVEDFVVVITKIDRVEQDRMTAVHESMQALLSAPCPVFAVDAVQGNGVAELKQFLSDRAEKLPTGEDSGYFRLSVDRAFLLKGTGLVVTGTAMSGQASVGDRLMLSPQGKTVRIRSIHAQDKPVDSCKAGQRCALNVLGDIQIDQVNRGDYLLHEKLALPTTRFDARFHMLPNAPFGLKHLSPVKLYIGATRKRAKLYLLQKQKNGNHIGPGESGLVQLIVESEIACCGGDRFLIRDDSESVTLGGGFVLDAHSPRIAKTKFSRLKFLAAMEQSTISEKIQALLIKHKQVIDLGRFRQCWNVRDNELDRVILAPALVEKFKQFALNGNDFAVAMQEWAGADRRLTRTLSDWHQENPKEVGIQLEDLKTRLTQGTEPELYDAVIIEQQKNGLLKIHNGLVSTSNHQAAVALAADRQWSELERVMAKHGAELPVISNLQQDMACDEPSLLRILDKAAKNGKVIRLSQSRFALASVLQALAASVSELAKEKPQFTIKEFKDYSGLSRNLTVEVLEYFDSIQLTVRDGNNRSVIKQKRKSDVPGGMPGLQNQ